jgi:hypothetical protein
MSDEIFSPEQIADVLGTTAEALREIQGFPSLIDGIDSQGEAVTGYSQAQFADWCAHLSQESKRKARTLIDLATAAEIIGADVDHLVQTVTPGMPRYDRMAPRPVYAGEAAVFIKEEVLAYRDRRTAMAQLVGRTVH